MHLVDQKQTLQRTWDLQMVNHCYWLDIWFVKLLMTKNPEVILHTKITEDSLVQPVYRKRCFPVKPWNQGETVKPRWNRETKVKPWNQGETVKPGLSVFVFEKVWGCELGENYMIPENGRVLYIRGGAGFCQQQLEFKWFLHVGGLISIHYYQWFQQKNWSFVDMIFHDFSLKHKSEWQIARQTEKVQNGQKRTNVPFRGWKHHFQVKGWNILGGSSQLVSD